MKRFIIAILLSLPLGLLLVTVMSGKIMADEAIQCPTQYGGAQYGTTPCPQNLAVNKLVRNPITGFFVENLLRGDATYSPGSEVVYELKIFNSSNQSFDTVTITDTVEPELKDPRLVDPSQAVNVSNPDNRTLKFDVKDLKAGETRTIKVKATVVDTVTPPTGDDKKCEVTNKVRVETAGQQPDEDTADLCIQVSVLGKVSLPEAGIADYLPLLPFAGMSITGIALFLKRSPVPTGTGKK